MKDVTSNFYAGMDQLVAEQPGNREDYDFLIDQLEAAAKSVLAEQGIAASSLSIATFVSEDAQLSTRANYALMTLTSVRLLRAWENDTGALRKDQFYRVALHAMNVGLWGGLISPHVSDLEGANIRQAHAQKKGGEAKNAATNATRQEIESTLMDLWREGVRHADLGHWVRSVLDRAPHLTPPKHRDGEQLKRTISMFGRKAFGDAWPVRRGKSS